MAPCKIAQVDGWEPYFLCWILYNTDPAQHVIMAGWGLIDLDGLSVHDLSVHDIYDISVQYIQ